MNCANNGIRTPATGYPLPHIKPYIYSHRVRLVVAAVGRREGGARPTRTRGRLMAAIFKERPRREAGRLYLSAGVVTRKQRQVVPKEKLRAEGAGRNLELYERPLSIGLARGVGVTFFNFVSEC